MTRKRAGAILIENGQIALIERHRPDRHYFVFPGGGVEAKETPAAAVVREVEEELGLQVVVQRLVMEVWYHHVPQYYFLVRTVGGEFGSGCGEEYTQEQPAIYGTYTPIWMPLGQVLQQPVLPSSVAEFVIRSHTHGWPQRTLRLYNLPAD